MITATARTVRWWVVLPTAGLLALAACGNDSDDSADEAADAVTAEVDDGETEDESVPVEAELFEGDGDFYAVPDPLPQGEPGTLLRYERLDEEQIAGAVSWRVMYLSESIQGEPIAVTGTVLVPADDPPEEGRRVVALAFPVNAIADECALSKNPLSPEGVDLGARLVEAGYVGARTDYEGLGTPGRHPYLVGESEGRGVLDAAKAAGQLPDADVSGELAIMGASHGGHAALWAQQLADDWAPEFDLVGTAVGEPVTELSTFPLLSVRGLLMMMLAGYAEAYPEADPSLVLTPDGVEALSGVDEGCTIDVVTHFASDEFSEIVEADPTEVEPWATLLDENDPGQVRTDAPLLITYSDPMFGPLSDVLFERLCDLSQVVELRVYTEGRGHDEHVGFEFLPAAPEWIDARFAGEEPVSDC
jgi:hypothetical protein